MSESDYSHKYCVIGAGPCGLGVMRVFKQRGIPFDCIEREDDVGGQWNYGKEGSSTCNSTHLITSKGLTRYRNYPMPDSYPLYPSHRKVWEYLRSYAREFGLYDHVTLNTSVERVEPMEDEFWRVTLRGGESRKYRGVVIANGHLSCPVVPSIPGEFRGTILHSSRYKTDDVLRGKRVLVVGLGNSGCDIASDAARVAPRTWLSVRGGYYFMPKFILGEASDAAGDWLHRWNVPLWIQRLLAWYPVHAAVGKPQDYGLPKPDHRLFEQRPIMNTHVLYLLVHGDIDLKPEIQSFDGDRVCFVDGSSEVIDIVVFATGFRIHIPFLAEKLLDWDRGRPRLWLNAFHPRFDRLFFAGLCSPDTLTWAFAEEHAEVMASFDLAMQKSDPSADWFRSQKAAATFPPTDGKHPVRDFSEIPYYKSVRKLRQVDSRLNGS